MDVAPQVGSHLETTQFEQSEVKEIIESSLHCHFLQGIVGVDYYRENLAWLALDLYFVNSRAKIHLLRLFAVSFTQQWQAQVLGYSLWLP